MRDFRELQGLVLEWARQRKILAHSNAQAQLDKMEEERQETLDALYRLDYAEVVDGIGDMLVCLIAASSLADVDPVDALNTAYEEIKDRTGYLSAEGKFVKDG